MFIPGQLISVITFPGVIVHELGHELACKLTKTPVYDVCYFRFGNPSGYVVHESNPNLHKNMFISLGPFFLNTILGILLTLPVSIRILTLENNDAFDTLLFWLGLSVLMHAFPSSGDAKNMFRRLNQTKGHFLSKLFYYPISSLIFIGAIGSVVWLDAIYGIAVAAFFPELIVKLLA